MKLSITIKELSTLEKDKDGYKYRLNGDFVRSGFKTEQEALDDAEHQLKKYVKRIIKK
jgi:hypothetical protein